MDAWQRRDIERSQFVEERFSKIMESAENSGEYEAFMALLAAETLERIAADPLGRDKIVRTVTLTVDKFLKDAAASFKEPTDHGMLLAKLLEKALPGALTKINNAHMAREIERGLVHGEEEDERAG